MSNQFHQTPCAVFVLCGPQGTLTEEFLTLREELGGPEISAVPCEIRVGREGSDITAFGIVNETFLNEEGIFFSDFKKDALEPLFHNLNPDEIHGDSLYILSRGGLTLPIIVKGGRGIGFTRDDEEDFREIDAVLNARAMKCSGGCMLYAETTSSERIKIITSGPETLVGLAMLADAVAAKNGMTYLELLDYMETLYEANKGKSMAPKPEEE